MKTKPILLCLSILFMAGSLAARRDAPQVPEIPGIWHPIVGSGAEYEVTDRAGKKSEIEITIVGRETDGSVFGHWMELATPGAVPEEQTYIKYLMVLTDAGVSPIRSVSQKAGQEPVETEASKLYRQARGVLPSDIRNSATLVGTESVTVPAGTFPCQHYRTKDGSSDVWIFDRVSPWGVVKSRTSRGSLILKKVIDDAQEHIAAPQKNNDDAS